MAKTKAIALSPGGDTIELSLPVYAGRYLATMTRRERDLLDRYAALQVDALGIDAAYDALAQIEAALANSRHGK